MKNNIIKELSIGSILIVLAVLILNPFNFWMPNTVLVCTLAITLVVFAIFASFVLREGALDERDMVHRMLAGRIAFISGSTVLIFGIITQAYMYSVDPWLVAALVIMILAKLGAHIYSDRNY